MLTAKEIMTTEVITVKESAWVAEAIGLMKRNNIHTLVVEPNGPDDAYGIISEADIAYKVIAPAKDPKAMTVGDIMTKPCIVVNPDLGVEYVARLFANTHIHKAPVIQEELLGIVSTTDIVRRAM
jgi:CBS domain-containing protein